MKQISIIYLSFLVSISVYAQQFSKADELFVDSIMYANYKPNTPGAVILIAKKGEPVYRKAYGLASMELNVPNKPENIFRIGSISKQFTAVCLLKLAQEGKLNLQDDIKKYLPHYNSHGKHITIENLLNHTSGIPSYSEKKNFESKIATDQSTDDLLAYFMNDSLLFNPGTDWSYSNSAYVVAGLIVEKVSGLSLTQYYRQNIFTPLGMSNTSVGNSDSVVINEVSGYQGSVNGKYMPLTYESWSWAYGAGGIISTVDDMLKWDNALYTNKIVKPEWLQKAWQPFLLPNGQQVNYGFGWALANYNNTKLIAHSGGMRGFLSDGTRVPLQQTYIIILSNTETIGPWDISSAIINRMLPQTTSNKAGKPINTNFNIYTGVYAMHRVGSRVAINMTPEKLYRYITFSNDTLFAQASGNSKEILKYVDNDLFLSQESNKKFKFNKNNKGLVTSIEIYSYPIQYGTNEMEFKTDLPLPKQKKAVVIDTKILETLTGKYDFGGRYFVEITLSGNRIYMQETGNDKQEIFAESATQFFLKEVDGTVEFKKQNGKITGLILNEVGKSEARKIE